MRELLAIKYARLPEYKGCVIDVADAAWVAD